MEKEKLLSPDDQQQLISLLQKRFEKNIIRHVSVNWQEVQNKLEAIPEKIWSLNQMETTGGEPDVIAFDESTKEFIFCDCSAESPKGRRSLCYDREALESRKEHKPKNNAIDLASEMGIEILTEEEYRILQSYGDFDTKTSSWVKTPNDIRNMGGAIFADFRYGHVFVYHNTAQSYYGVRGFRGSLRV